MILDDTNSADTIRVVEVKNEGGGAEELSDNPDCHISSSSELSSSPHSSTSTSTTTTSSSSPPCSSSALPGPKQITLLQDSQAQQTLVRSNSAASGSSLRASADSLMVSQLDSKLSTNNNNIVDNSAQKESTPPLSGIDGSSDGAPTEGASTNQVCYNQVLDDEIRSKLDRLNALSDSINRLEGQFDEANRVFRETLKCSTDRLTTIAKALGSKSIMHGRVYHAAKASVEQSQSDCQRACISFERANRDHLFARKAIQEAESKLKKISNKASNHQLCKVENGFSQMTLNETKQEQADEILLPDRDTQTKKLPQEASMSGSTKLDCDNDARESNGSCEKGSNELSLETEKSRVLSDTKSTEHAEDQSAIDYATKLSEDLNHAILRLVEAENKRGQSEKQHLDKANKLMLAQENLLKLEREHGQSIKRSKLYFDESRRFNAKLSSLKEDINRISGEISASKQAYAKTLEELEAFSEELHYNSASLLANGPSSTETDERS